MLKTQIYHQCGHNYRWNLDSLVQDNVGQGLILSPCNMEHKHIRSLPSQVKKVSFFDPQFYLPNSEQKHLNTYDFFPNSMCGDDGYSTSDFEDNSQNCADLCVYYQNSQDLKYIVIPTLSPSDNLPNFFTKLDGIFVTPFLNAVGNQNIIKPILLSAVVKESQLNETELRDEYLTFLTSYPQISGVYLIPHIKKTSKRIKSIDFLYNLLTFIDDLRQSGLEVHTGYMDVESYLLTLADVNSISVGSYENVREFGTIRFEKKEPGKVMRGPTPRIFSTRLLQWIDHQYKDTILIEYPDGHLVFDETSYKVTMFEPSFNWNFQKSELYKHYFTCMQNLVRGLPDDLEERYNLIVNGIQIAMTHFENMKKNGILFDSDSDGSHLPIWGTAINRFIKYKRGV